MIRDCSKEHHNPLKKTTSAQQDALRSRDIPESGRHDQEAGIIRRSKPLEDHEEISHASRLPGEHASFPKTREHKKKRRRCHEHDTTATESGPPASDRDHSQRLAGGVQVMLYAGQHYHLAKNNQDLLARAQALVKDVGKGDYPCPLELSVHAVF